MPPYPPCPGCGREPGPNLVLHGWHPCTCGGHRYTHCRADNGGCGTTLHDPPLDPATCTDATFGFTR